MGLTINLGTNVNKLEMSAIPMLTCSLAYSNLTLTLKETNTIELMLNLDRLTKSPY